MRMIRHQKYFWLSVLQRTLAMLQLLLASRHLYFIILLKAFLAGFNEAKNASHSLVALGGLAKEALAKLPRSARS